MRDFMEFECTPSNESCVQVDPSSDYMPAMREEARRMIELLNGRFPDLEGEFRIARANHDFGSYIEIRFYYDETERGYAEMNFVESNWPMTWKDTEPVCFSHQKAQV